MYRAYNGALYEKGVEKKNRLPFRAVSGDVVRCDLDLNEGTLSYFHNGTFSGIGFRGITGTVFPAVATYGSGRSVRLKRMVFGGDSVLNTFNYSSCGVSFHSLGKIAEQWDASVSASYAAAGHTFSSGCAAWEMKIEAG